MAVAPASRYRVADCDTYRASTSADVVALIPAHNEQTAISAAIESLADQTQPPDRIIVVADNCTDDTAAVAAGYGVEVFTTSHNTDRKAGALNQALAWLLPQLDGQDRVLITDADSELAPSWIEAGTAGLAPSDVGAIGGVFHGASGAGLVGQLQRNEYERYSRDVGRRKARAWVLTGTASMFRAATLRHVIKARAAGMLGRRVDPTVYDRGALTEDMEITLALKTLGYRCLSPRACAVTTEVMPTWRDLWRQRTRWQRGAVDNLTSYALTRTTVPYWAQQAGMCLDRADPVCRRPDHRRVGCATVLARHRRDLPGGTCGHSAHRGARGHRIGRRSVVRDRV